MQLTMPEKQRSFRRLPFVALLMLAALGAAGAAYWHASGRLSFEGSLHSNVTALLAEQGGTVVSVEAAPGRYVRKGDVLLRFDEAPLRRTLLAERDKLAQAERLVPPEHLRRPAPGMPDEALTERLERQRGVEDEATRRLQQATDREAQAAILYNRASIMAAQGKLAPGERDAAEAALAAAKRETEAARKHFETLSLERAATGTDIRRIRDEQRGSGAESLPVEARLHAYRQQAARVAEAEQALASASVAAPEDGFVLALAVKVGDAVPAMFPSAVFRSASALPMVTARVDESARKKLRPGQRCTVRLDGWDKGREALAGYVAYIAPPRAGAGAEEQKEAASAGVWVALALEAAVPDQELADMLLLDDGARAEVTVLLREPPHPLPARERPADTRPAPASGAEFAPASPGRAAPPASPLSVQTPFGALPEEGADPPPTRPVPVLVKSTGQPGEPEAAAPQGQPPAVNLPAMQAPPYPPSGSPLPDPRNNPSLATPEALQREGAAPR